MSGLAACGDKVVLPDGGGTTTPSDSSVQQVSVSPATAQISVGGSQTFVASVIGGAQLQNRNVTWSSSNPAVATVNATTGVATGVSAGTTSIIATSAANTAVRGAATLVVAAQTPASLSFFQVQNQFGLPATLNNAAGQLNIVANVDPGQSGLSRVVLLATCPAASGTGTTVFRVDSANVAGSTGSQTGQQVTIPFNTSRFDPATGTVTYRNQTCTLSIEGRTAAGAIVTTATGPQVTLNNADVVAGTIVGARNAADEQGLRWDGGAVTVTLQPIFYSASVPATLSVTLTGADTDGAGVITATAAATQTAGVWTATFAEGSAAHVNGSATLGNNLTIPALTASVQGISAAGQTIVDPTTGMPFTVNTVASAQLAAPVASSIRYDNENPVAPTFTFATQNGAYGTLAANTGFINSSFNFGTTPTAALGFGNLGTNVNGCAATGPAGTANNLTLCDHDGVDRVAETYSYTTSNPATTTSTYTTITTASAIPETASGSTYGLRLMTCDALNNCTTTVTALRFGVDLTAPVINNVTAPTNNSGATTTAGLNGGGSVAIVGIDSASAAGVNGSGFGPSPVIATLSVLQPSGTSGQAARCVSFNGVTLADGTVVAAGATYVVPTTGCIEEAIPFNFVLPAPVNGEYRLRYRVVDLAGNTTATGSRVYQVDGAAPTISGGIAIPATVTAGTAFTTSALDNTDLSTSTGVQDFTTLAIRFAQSATATPTGVIGDSALTRSSSISYTPAPFYGQLQTAGGAGTASAADVLDNVIIRARDVIGNISADIAVALPAANVSTGTAFSTTTNNVQSFAVTAAPATVYNGTGTPTTNATSTTLSAVINVGTFTGASPFTEVCFYYQSNGGANQGGALAGEYVLIGCQSAAAVTQDAGGNRIFTYSTAGFNPPASLGTGTVNVIAVGSNGNAGLVSTATALNLNGV